jgi:hypothetical protein
MATVTHVTEEVVTSVTEIHKDVTLNAIISLRSKRMNILSPYIRINKLIEIRHKLAEDKYEIKKRLDVAIDRLLEGLFTKVTTKPTDLQSLIPDDEDEPNVQEYPNYWPEDTSEFLENRKYLWLWN